MSLGTVKSMSRYQLGSETARPKDGLHVVQLPSRVGLFATPWTIACESSVPHHLQSLPKFMYIALMMPYSHLILWRPLLLLFSVFPSIRDFRSESAVLIRWPKYWSFIFSISLSIEYSGLISLRIHWFDLFAVQKTPFNLHSCLQITLLRSCTSLYTHQLLVFPT